jgi:poly(A) polymerase
VAAQDPESLFDAVAALAGEPRPALAGEAVSALRRYRSGLEPVPIFPLRGADLLAKGIERGPRVGALLEEARRAWIAQGCPTGRDAARALLRDVLSRAEP